jgi:hypothetical protein
VYSRKIDDRVLTFGVSGLLYKSNVLMYDRQTESLWSQVKREAVAGPLTGTELEVLPSTLTTWEKWKKRYPDTEVLSKNTGYDRDYSEDPYKGYYESSRGLFSFFRPGPDEEAKELIAGVTVNGQAKAYPLKLLREKKQVTDGVGGKELTLTFDPETDDLAIRDQKGQRVPYISVYWFVWQGIHPETQRYSAKN